MRFLLPICLALAACGSAPGHPLLGEWRIVEIDGRPPLADSWPGLEFRRAMGAGRIGYSANTGCNMVDGSFTADGEALRPNRDGTTTTIGCAEVVTRQQEAISSILAEARGWRRRPDGAVVIRTGAGASLVLVRGRAPSSRAWLPETSVEAPGLIGDWRVVTEAGAPAAPMPMSITITPVGIHFRIECVVRSWTYKAGEGRIATKRVPMESCELGAPPIAETVWAVLEGARSYSVVENDRAIITAGDGRRVYLRRALSG